MIFFTYNAFLFKKKHFCRLKHDRKQTSKENNESTHINTKKPGDCQNSDTNSTHKFDNSRLTLVYMSQDTTRDIYDILENVFLPLLSTCSQRQYLGLTKVQSGSYNITDTISVLHFTESFTETCQSTTSKSCQYVGNIKVTKVCRISQTAVLLCDTLVGVTT